jgi:hypothetical protein
MSKAIYIELAAILGAIGFGVAGLIQPDVNWEPPVVLSGLVTAGAEIARRLGRRSKRGRFESNAARIRHREALRKACEEEIYRCRAGHLRQDVIIRHVDRVDAYPNADDGTPGISPWFRVGLVDTYERGIVVCLRIGGLKRCEDGFRYVDYVNGEEQDITAWLMGDIPYDSIEAVNMDGDKYYHFPHIYCHFDYSGEPYERLWFSDKIDQPHGHPYFKPLAEYDEVAANNRSEGTLYFA